MKWANKKGNGSFWLRNAAKGDSGTGAGGLILRHPYHLQLSYVILMAFSLFIFKLYLCMFQRINERVQKNWKAGLTVALVSLPLSIALAIASGASPVAGVITGVWAAAIAALLGGSQFNIVGAAGALITLLAGFSLSTGAIFLPFLAIMTGVIMLLVYVCRLEKYLIYIPTSVMYGFAAGVAILIAIGQLNDAFGLINIPRHAHFLENIKETFGHISGFHLATFGVFLVSIIMLRVLRKYAPKFPGVVIVAVLGIIFGFLITTYAPVPASDSLTRSASYIVTLEKKFPQGVDAAIANFSHWKEAKKVFTSSDMLMLLLKASFVVAMVGILETLITAKLGDVLTKQRSDTRKELFALGLANIGSGIMGGLPATGVFIRTGLNIKSGAQDRTSGILNAVFTAILALALIPFFKFIPMAVIAAILFNVAIGLIEIEKFHFYWEHEKKSFLVAVFVAVVCVFEDPSIGILSGAVLALLFFVDRLSGGVFEMQMNKDKRVIKRIVGNKIEPLSQGIDTVVYTIDGILAYINAQAHAENLRVLSASKDVKNIILRMREVFYVDMDALDVLANSIEELESKGKNILITGISSEVRGIILSHHFFISYFKKHSEFTKTTEALLSIGFTQSDIGNKAYDTVTEMVSAKK